MGETSPWILPTLEPCLVVTPASSPPPLSTPVNNCALQLIYHGDLETAGTILEKLLAEASKVLDRETSEEISIVTGNHANIYTLREEPEKGEALERKVANTSRARC